MVHNLEVSVVLIWMLLSAIHLMGVCVRVHSFNLSELPSHHSTWFSRPVLRQGTQMSAFFWHRGREVQRREGPGVQQRRLPDRLGHQPIVRLTRLAKAWIARSLVVSMSPSLVQSLGIVRLFRKVQRTWKHLWAVLKPVCLTLAGQKKKHYESGLWLDSTSSYHRSAFNTVGTVFCF